MHSMQLSLAGTLLYSCISAGTVARDARGSTGRLLMDRTVNGPAKAERKAAPLFILHLSETLYTYSSSYESCSVVAFAALER